MIRNYGISFGLSLPVSYLLVTIGLMLVVLIWYRRSRNWRLLLVIAGGGLNLLERLRYGYITDYWKIPYIGVYNNLNDWLIFAGVVLFVWQYLKERK